MMNSSRAKTSVYTIITVFFVFAIIVLVLHTDESTGSLFSISILKLDKSWLSQESKTGHEDIIANDISTYTHTSNSVLAPDESSNYTGIDNEEEFIVSSCDIAKGKWVFNNMSKPLYSDHSCPYLDKEVSCVKNGRTDSDYRHWEWQPDDCVLPRFDPKAVLNKLRNKRLMFVGDSLQKNQWQSFVCQVQSVIPAEQKSMQRGRPHSIFMAKEYNSTIEFYWAPFLIESNTDLDIIADPRKRILKVDSVTKHAQYWMGVDILVFNTYIWWMNGIKIKSLWGSFANGDDGFEELDAEVAYRIGLKTWANWVDSTVDPNKTRVFFTTMSPIHMGSYTQHEKRGYRCYNETRPFQEYWGRYLSQRVTNIVSSVVERMRIPVQFINITQMSEQRIDGHASVYTESGENVITDEQKHHSDCIHWCLPVVDAEEMDKTNTDDEEFLENKCDVTKGKWVFNNLSQPLYSDQSCPYIDKQVSCVKNGRTDSDYRHWEWQPDDCVLPRFDPEVVLDKLGGKRLMFVGDSLQRNQWQSFVCLVQSVIPPEQKTMRRHGRSHTVFKAKEYNATIEFYWAPFLIESNSDLDIISDPRKRILKVDSVSKHAQYWLGVDILIFNTYIWWMNGIKIKSLWGSFSNGEDGYEELEAEVAYRIALKTWANWVDSTIASNKTRVLFTTMSPTHMGSIDRHEKKGFRCYNETKPFNKYWGRDLNRRVMNIVASVVDRMKIPVQFINITQMSEHRIDGHASVYTEFGGKVVTDEEKAKPRGHTDCIHWCLPGVPDTWNQLFFSYL
ncbi:hypothetical protein MKW92_023069 [Papaver armeniacum]|nr:hypothetical protein MKW92_023069 [Papaver armeniacum]